MINLTFEQFQEKIAEDLEIADLIISFPPNDINEYYKALHEWNLLDTIQYEIEEFLDRSGLI